MPLPSVCSTRAGASIAQIKPGGFPNRQEVTFYGLHSGAKADSEVAESQFAAFAAAINRLAKILGRSEKVDPGKWVGVYEMSAAYAVSNAAPEELRGAAMSRLLMHDMRAVSEEEMRVLVRALPNLTREMNGASSALERRKAQGAQRFLPLLIGGAILGLAIRGLASKGRDHGDSV